jgi:hypothetical protein
MGEGRRAFKMLAGKRPLSRLKLDERTIWEWNLKV